jgi:hypothetical protein
MNEFKVGDKVRVIDPDSYLQEWANKFRNREGIVEKLGGTTSMNWKGYVFVRFLKRNGRGQEFTRWMPSRSVELIPAESPAV